MAVLLSDRDSLFYRSILVFLFSIFFISLMFSTGCGDETSGAISINISPSSATVGVNQVVSFSANGYSAAGFLVQVAPAWSVTGGIGSMNSSRGLFTAGNTTGVGRVVANFDGSSASVPVTITESCWVTGKVTGSLGAVQGIRVYLLQLPTLEGYAGSDGVYQIANVPAGTYVISTNRTSVYLTSSREVTVARGATLSGINFVLQTQAGIGTTSTTLPSF